MKAEWQFTKSFLQTRKHTHQLNKTFGFKLIWDQNQKKQLQANK